MRASRCAAIAALVCLGCLAQRRLEPEQMYERIICVVPMIGKGTPEDPRRPMFTPADPVKDADDRKATLTAKGESADEPDKGIIAFSALPSDDGKFAIVEFVAKDRRAFKEILETTRPDVQSFRRDRASREALTNELKKFKRDLNLDMLRTIVQ